MAWLIAIAKALPAILELVITIKNIVATKVAEGRGRAEAVAAGVAQANADLVYANQIGAEADADHAAHPNDDAGFDPDGERKD